MDIVFDIDGTIADLSHRLHHIKEKPKNWPAFDKAQVDDTVIENVKKIYDYLANDPDNRIIFASGRSDRNYNQTREWLEKNGFTRFSVLYMRKEGDYRSDVIIKEEILETMRKDGFNPKICFDDRLGVSKMWAEKGVFCFCVNQGLKEF